jgi:hypothetical protein
MMHINDPSAADARDRPEFIARRRRSREKEEDRKKKPNLIAALEFRGILIDTPNPLIK